METNGTIAIAELREKTHQRLTTALVAFSGNSKLPQLDGSSDLTDILESLAHFEFLLTVEKEFALKIPDEALTASRMRTINGIVDVLCECISKANASRGP